MWIRNLSFISLCAVGLATLVGSLLPQNRVEQPPNLRPTGPAADSFHRAISQINREYHDHWRATDVSPTVRASTNTIIRRISLALIGTIPSLEEQRAIEQVPNSERVDWWLNRLLQDRRHSDYLAERLARSYVGTEDGPFLIFRRRRFVTWLSDQLHQNLPYNKLVNELISGTGLWTDSPAVNFITVTTDVNGDEQPDEERLAARTSRAFLGIRLDCVQCHDDHLNGEWLQSDFHHLAAFYAGAQSSPLGIQDQEATYEYQFLGETEPVDVAPTAPFLSELDSRQSIARQRLADWVTHPDNDVFRRAIINRIWALMFGKPLVAPIDNIPLEGPYPPGLEILSHDFGSNNFDLRRLIRMICQTQAFQLDSRDSRGATAEQERQWAIFPLTRLRPEQVAGSLLQASLLTTIDANSHIFVRLMRYQQEAEFVERYGDRGEDEFGNRGGTIPQRLLLMNGQLISARTKDDLIGNASTRIAALAQDNKHAIDSAYLAILTRLPSLTEQSHFLEQMKDTSGPARRQILEDLYWTLFNSTEFSWNH
ncbi:MAG: DUF1553 domain-containing protein [Planctomycetaceae bacterium]|nr:DUF1553 domain-containing protein [Planctomycetaceae bacterium]